MIAFEQVSGLGQNRLRLGIRSDRGAVIHHHDLEGCGPKSREVPLDDRPSLDGLAVGCLPASTGKSTLDPDGEEAEHDEDQQPSNKHPTEVSCRPCAEPCERAGMGFEGLSVTDRSGRVGRGRWTHRRLNAGRRVCVEIDAWGRCHRGLPLIARGLAETSSRYPCGYSEDSTIPRGVSPPGPTPRSGEARLGYGRGPRSLRGNKEGEDGEATADGSQVPLGVYDVLNELRR